MTSSGGAALRTGRVLFVFLALVANLVVAGVPVLHAWAHAADDEHAAPAAAVEADHPHDEVHPPAFHDECVLTHRAVLDLALALAIAAGGFQPVSLRNESAPSFRPVAPVASRAPPAPAQARAPPLS